MSTLGAPAVAHEIDVAAGVAGLWHIEPDHHPRAGEPAKIWIALTREGGVVLPLSQANCELAIYTQPQKPLDQPILTPILKPITAEQYQGMPGTEVIFPQVGIYRLHLGCNPKTKGHFQPFELNYPVTVSAGKASPAPSPVSPQAQVQSQAGPATLTWIGGAIAGLILLGMVLMRLGIFKGSDR
jgi:hypothetical protein